MAVQQILAPYGAESGVPVPEGDALTFTALEDSSIKLTATGSPTVSGLAYRRGTSGVWSKYTCGTELSMASGDKIQFANTASTLSTSSSDYVQFVLSSGKIAASGNVMSMLNYATECTPYCFNLMFCGCTSLTTAPELPATTLTAYCYQAMFLGCYSLRTAPELPATTLAANCYVGMFQSCFNLTAAPELPATTLAAHCYIWMFVNCKHLDHVKAAFTTAWGSYTNSWLDGVASSGTFYKKSACPTPSTRGTSTIPSGWTIIDY